MKNGATPLANTPELNIRLVSSFMLLTALLAGCHSDLTAYRSSVERDMKDPQSAQYRNDRLVTNKEGLTHYCGEVNAKNGMGGYVGFQRFIASSESVSLETRSSTPMASDAFRRFWDRNCGK